MTDEEKHEILARAEMESGYGLKLADPHGLERWRAEALEAEARRARERARTTDEINAQRAAEWERWMRGHLANEREFVLKIVGTAVGEIRAKLREQLRAEFRHEIALAVKELRAEFACVSAHNAGQVIDLPALPLRRRSHGAA